MCLYHPDFVRLDLTFTRTASAKAGAISRWAGAQNLSWYPCVVTLHVTLPTELQDVVK